MNYGIKIQSNQTISLNTFKKKADLEEAGFQEISKKKYEEILALSIEYPYGKYDGQTWVNETDEERIARDNQRELNANEKEIARELALDNIFIERYNRLKAAGDIT